MGGGESKRGGGSGSIRDNGGGSGGGRESEEDGGGGVRGWGWKVLSPDNLLRVASSAPQKPAPVKDERIIAGVAGSGCSAEYRPSHQGVRISITSLAG